MNRNVLKLVVLLCVLSITKAQLSTKPVFKCDQSGPKDYIVCTFTNISFNTTHYEWQPTSDDPKSVTEVRFEGEKVMPVVTSAICDTFPNMKRLRMPYMSIKVIKKDAFRNCTSLTNLELSFNEIEELHSDTFHYLHKLQSLTISINKIRHLDINTFSNNTELEVLFLSEMDLYEFPSDLVKHNKKLQWLNVHGNNLPDLEVEKIDSSHPALQQLYWMENEISCTRTIEIYNYLEASKVIRHIATGGYKKVRYYPQETVLGNVKCNPDISWMASNYRKHQFTSLATSQCNKWDFDWENLVKEVLKIGKQCSVQQNLDAMQKQLLKLEEKLDKLTSLLGSEEN